jgi:voltage-gated potassium channel
MPNQPADRPVEVPDLADADARASNADMSLRQRTWQILEPAGEDDAASRRFDGFLLTLIALNVLAVVVESVAWVRQDYGWFLTRFEWFSIAAFSIEYLMRVWSAPSDERYRGALGGRLRFVRSPMALVDLLAVLPFYLPFVGIDLRVVRTLRLLRLFRAAKLWRYVSAVGVMAGVIRSRREELVVTTFVLLALLLVSSSLMYYAEHEAQPEAFSSIPAAMWWAVATLTTVGYGDVYPVTALGRLLASIVAVLGIGFVALPTAIVGSGFVEELGRRGKGQGRCPFCGQEFSGNRTNLP